MIPLLLLVGCGEREATLNEGFAAFRQSVTTAEHIALTAELTAEYEQTTASYTLAADYDGQETVIQVLAPEIIAGVQARAKWGEATVAYDNVILAAGALDEEGLTPVSAIPAMLEAMASGYVELLWWEEDYVAARLYVGQDSVCTLWLDGESLTPVHGEIASGGRQVISCEFTSWEISQP
jgi:hypothetical protein